MRSFQQCKELFKRCFNGVVGGTKALSALAQDFHWLWKQGQGGGLLRAIS